MVDIIHKRNGKIIDGIVDFEELTITKDFLNRKEEANINITDLVIKGREAEMIIERVNNGLNGGEGIYEGDPYEIEVGTPGNTAFRFEGYLDYADDFEQRGCNEVKVSLKKRKGTDWLVENANFSFRSLYDSGRIKDSDFVKVPYIINFVPDGPELVILGISTYMMIKEFVESIKRTAEAVSLGINAATPVVGVGLGLGAVAVTAVDIGDIIDAGIRIGINIAYTVAAGFAIKNLIELVFEQLLPKKREHLGIRLKTLFERACQELGLDLTSSILDEWSDAVIIPMKENVGGEKPPNFQGNFKEKGIPTADGPTDNFDQLITVFKEIFNADFEVKGDEFIFERKDFWKKSGNYTIPDVFNDQKNARDTIKKNTDEIKANYNINFVFDNQDQNTLVNQEGRVFQAITEPIVTKNKDLVNIPGLEEIRVPFAQGTTKNELNNIEESLKVLGTAVDRITGIFGGGTNFASKIDARKGSLLLSSHYITRPKIVWMNGSKLEKNQRDFISAELLWDNFHSINSFVEINGIHNQYTKHPKVEVKFCLENFLSLLDSNYAKTIDGKEALIELLKYKVGESKAEIDYRVLEKHTNNLRIRKI